MKPWLPVVGSLTLLGAVVALAQGSTGWTQQQFDDWLDQTKAMIDDQLTNGANPLLARYKTEVCVEGTIRIVSFKAVLTFLVPTQTLFYQIVSDVLLTGQKCPPSEANGMPLPYTNVLQPILSPPRFTQARPSANQPAPRDSTSVPAVARELPFEAIYSPSVVPSPPGCDMTVDTPVLLVNHGTGTVTIMGGCSGTVKQTIPVVSNPLQAAVTPDGSLALVTSFNNAVNFIDTPAGQVVFTLQTTSDIVPDGIAISPDGTKAYVTSFGSPIFGDTPALLTINIAQRAIVQQLALPDFPQSVFLSPDGSLAWVTFPLNDQIYIVDTLSNTVATTLSTNAPMAVAFNTTGEQAWVSNGLAFSTVTVYETTTCSVLKTVPVGAGPIDIMIGPDDSFVLVNNYFGQSISYVDPRTYAVSTVNVGGSPMGLVLIQ